MIVRADSTLVPLDWGFAGFWLEFYELSMVDDIMSWGNSELTLYLFFGRSPVLNHVVTYPNPKKLPFGGRPHEV